jgi:hypothetical protein
VATKFSKTKAIDGLDLISLHVNTPENTYGAER